MKHYSTDLDRDSFELSDTPGFGKAMLIYWASGFLFGCFLGAFLLWAGLNVFAS